MPQPTSPAPAPAPSCPCPSTSSSVNASTAPSGLGALGTSDCRRVYTHPLAHVRACQGWSQQRLAELLRMAAARHGLNLGTNKNRVWRWENYGTTPDIDAQRMLAELLGVPLEEISTRPWPGWLPGCVESLTAFTWSRDGCIRALAEARTHAQTDRRGYLPLTGVPLAAVSADWLLSEPERAGQTGGGPCIDPALVVATRERINALRRMEDHLGGAGLRTLVEGELSLVITLLQRDSRASWVNRELFVAAAELAQLAGWTAFDAGLHSLAQRYYLCALRAAHAAHHRALGGYVLSCMSYQLTTREHPRDAVRLVQSALEGSKGTLSPENATLLRLRLALAHAAAGNTTACVRTLSSATSTPSKRLRPASARVPAPNVTMAGAEPPWLYWLKESHQEALTGHCMARLGRTDDAVTLLRRAVDAERSSSFSRDAAIHLAWLSDAYLRARKYAEASGAAARAATMMARLDSPRGHAMVASLYRRMSQHGDPPPAPPVKPYAA